MTLTSAFEDFMHNTLQSLPSVLTRLEYVASLREPSGEYGHWGMNRVYGESRAQAALSQAHMRLFLEVLRSPIRELLTELVPSPGPTEDCALKRLAVHGERAVPRDCGGGSALHLESVLAALSALADAGQEPIG